MAHGTPDFGITSGKETVYSLTDMAELVARLGSIVTYDRRGDIFLLNNFEGNINSVNPFGSGTGHNHYLSQEYARSGEFSYKLIAGSDGNHLCQAYLYSYLPAMSKVGFEISFNGGHLEQILEWELDVYSGTRRVYGIITHNNDTGVLAYYDEDRNYITIASDIHLSVTGGLWHTFKLVIDPTNIKYCRILLDSHAYDLSDYAMYSTASSASPSVNSIVQITGKLGQNTALFIDDWVLTQSEP